MKGLIKFFATGFYSGLAPYFPGTVGSVFAFVMAWFLRFDVLAIVVLSILGVYICTQGELIFQKHDCSHIVFDEFCGSFCAAWQLHTIPQFMTAFILFRIFDILKPIPVNNLQALPRGWGVMADDLAAGIISRLIIAVLIYFGFM